MWDPETKQVVRWRASLGGKYYFITDWGEVDITEDFQWNYDNWHFDFGNYFATEALARKAIESFKNFLAL